MGLGEEEEGCGKENGSLLSFLNRSLNISGHNVYAISLWSKCYSHAFHVNLHTSLTLALSSSWLLLYVPPGLALRKSALHSYNKFVCPIWLSKQSPLPYIAFTDWFFLWKHTAVSGMQELNPYIQYGLNTFHNQGNYIHSLLIQILYQDFTFLTPLNVPCE
jgi:hypothetical protein